MVAISGLAEIAGTNGAPLCGSAKTGDLSGNAEEMGKILPGVRSVVVLAALAHRADTGKGQRVDIAGAEAMMKFVDYNITWMHTAGRERQGPGRFDPAVFPSTHLRGRGGPTLIAAD